MNDSYPLSPEVGILCLLLTGICPVHGIVLLKLHSLHLLLDGVHGDQEGVTCKKDKKQSENLDKKCQKSASQKS